MQMPVKIMFDFTPEREILAVLSCLFGELAASIVNAAKGIRDF